MARGLCSCASWALERRLSSCGSRAQLLHDMWDLPGPGLEPLSPALAGRFLTTEPPGKPQYKKLLNKMIKKQTHRYREQTSGYQWGEERREGQHRGKGFKKRVIMGLNEIMCVKLWKIVKHCRIF